MKIAENFFGFWDNFVRTLSGKISLLRREYIWSHVSLLKHSPKIFDLVRRGLTILDLSDMNGKLS